MFDFHRHGSGLQSYAPGKVSVHSPAPEKQSARVPEPTFSPIKQKKLVVYYSISRLSNDSINGSHSFPIRFL